VASPLLLLRADGEVLVAWCELLDYMVEYRVFYRRNWIWASGFELCLRTCLALLQQFRTQLMTTGRAGASSQPPLQCLLEPSDLHSAVARFDGWSKRPLFAGLLPYKCLANVPSLLEGYVDVQTFSEDALAQVVGWSVFAVGSTCASVAAGGLLGLLTMEAVQRVLQVSSNLLGTSREARILSCAYVMLGLSPIGAQEYTPVQIEAQIQFSLGVGGDQHVLWAAYEYIRTHQHPGLRDPFNVRKKVLQALQLDPSMSCSVEEIRKRRWTLCRLFDDEEVEQVYKEFSRQFIDERYYQQEVVLGKGGFGTVRRGVRRSDQQPVAIKMIYKTPVTCRLIQQERSLMRVCGAHANVLELLDDFEALDRFYLVVPYCDGGDLDDKLKALPFNRQLCEREVAEWARDICAAIAALHSAKVCHRDIKPKNFLIAGSTLKLADFGLAVFVAANRLRTEKCGTPFFMAPEQVNLPDDSPGYSFPVDVWAAGVTLGIMLDAGQLPATIAAAASGGTGASWGKLSSLSLASHPALAQAHEPHAWAHDGEWDGDSGDRRTEAFQLRARMLRKRPEDRASAQDLLQCPWLSRAAG